MQNLNNGSVVNLGTASFGEAKQETNMSTPRSFEPVNPLSNVIGLTPKLNLNTIKVIKKDKDSNKIEYLNKKIKARKDFTSLYMLVDLPTNRVLTTLDGEEAHTF